MVALRGMCASVGERNAGERERTRKEARKNAKRTRREHTRTQRKTKAGTQKAHSDAPGVEEIAGARKLLGWKAPPFVIPEPLLRQWREIGAKGRTARMAWAERVQKAPDDPRKEFERRNRGDLPTDWKAAIAAARGQFIESGKAIATRAASGAVLDHLFAAIPEMLGGSADLTPSNNTRAKGRGRDPPGRVQRLIRALRRAGTRHGGGDERHRAAWRPDPVRRHLPDLLGLLAPGHPAGRHDADPHYLCHDARLHRAGGRRADASAD